MVTPLAGVAWHGDVDLLPRRRRGRGDIDARLGPTLVLVSDVARAIIVWSPKTVSEAKLNWSDVPVMFVPAAGNRVDAPTPCPSPRGEGTNVAEPTGEGPPMSASVQPASRAAEAAAVAVRATLSKVAVEDVPLAWLVTASPAR